MGSNCKGDRYINLPKTSNHVVLYTSPVYELRFVNFVRRHVALVGETGKLGLVSKSRIHRIEIDPVPFTASVTVTSLKMRFKHDIDIDDMFKIILHIRGAKREEVSFTWLDALSISKSNDGPNHSSFKYVTEACVIGEDGTAVYIIHFPYIQDSFVICN